MTGVRPLACCWSLAASLALQPAAPPAASAAPGPPGPGAQQRPGPPPGLPVTRLDERPRAADLDGVRAVSLSFSDPLPVRDVLLMLLRGSPFSVVFEPGVTGKFIGELSDLTLRQALEAVLFSAALDYSLQGTVVRVMQRRPETRFFEVDHPAVRRELRRVQGPAGADDPAPARLTTTVESELLEELGRGVQALLSPAGRVHLDRQAGLLQVTDFSDRLSDVGVYVEAVAARATRQVRLQAHVLEVTLAGSAVVDWPAVLTRAGADVAQASGVGFRVADFAALIRALGAAGAVRTIAAPQLLAMHNQPAYMRVGTASAAFVGGAEPAPAEGLLLTITPHISADGVVQMSVAPSFVEHGGGRGAVVVEADSVMRVRDGETVVVSGLVREYDGTPDDPRRRRETAGSATVRKELIVLITPAVAAAGEGRAGPSGPGLR